MKAMVLAAGAGTRLRPLTYEITKPMVPVANRPVLHHVLDNLKRHGILEVMVNLHAHPNQVRGYCGRGERWGMKIQYSMEPRLLGTAGAVKKVERFFKDGTFVILSGDGLSDVDLTSALGFHVSRRALGTMVLKELDSRLEYGITLTHKDGRIKGFLEKPALKEVFQAPAVNTGIYIFEPEVFRHIPKGRPYDFGYELWPKLLKRGLPIYGWTMKGYWCDVGNLAEYRRSQLDALAGKVRIRIPGRRLKPGVWVEGGSRIHPKARLVPPAMIGRRVSVGAGSQVGPGTVVGADSRISQRAVVKNCILFDRVSVGRNVHLANCIIGPDGTITEDITVYGGEILNVRA